jgi:hypothetical protein
LVGFFGKWKSALRQAQGAKTGEEIELIKFIELIKLIELIKEDWVGIPL